MLLNVLESMNMNETPVAQTPVYEHVELPFEGQFVKEASEFVNNDMISECSNNIDLIHQSAMLEAAKMDAALQNFMKEGKDYKGLKKDLNTILDAYDLPKEEFTRKSNKYLTVCKRVLQIALDLSTAVGVPAGAAGAVAMATTTPGALPVYIILFVVAFIVDRLLRFAVDTAEFNKLESDVKKMISDLRASAEKCDDKKHASKMNAAADKLEKALNKHSK